MQENAQTAVISRFRLDHCLPTHSAGTDRLLRQFALSVAGSNGNSLHRHLRPFRTCGEQSSTLSAHRYPIGSIFLVASAKSLPARQSHGSPHMKVRIRGIRMLRLTDGTFYKSLVVNRQFLKLSHLYGGGNSQCFHNNLNFLAKLIKKFLNMQ